MAAYDDFHGVAFTVQALRLSGELSAGDEIIVVDNHPQSEHGQATKRFTEWLEKYDWSDSTKAGAAQTVRTAFRWLRREGHIATNPVAEAKGPSKKGRETILSDAEFAAVLEHSRPDFQKLLEFLRNSGCRPQEAVIIEARHVDLANRRIVLPPSKAKGKKHPRVIYLNDRALEITAEALRKHPEGRLFRTKTGKPWDRNKVRCRFRRLRAKVGSSYCAYHLRHTFATDALQSTSLQAASGSAAQAGRDAVDPRGTRDPNSPGKVWTELFRRGRSLQHRS
jgi:integrase